MKKISLILTMAFVLAFSLTAAADEEEFSSSANISYDYDEYYDETESPEETTSETSDDVKTSYKEDYDEYSTQDLTSDKYDETCLIISYRKIDVNIKYAIFSPLLPRFVRQHEI